MITLSAISGYWKRLNKTFNDLVAGINQRTPRQGVGISINEGPSGFMISLAGALPPVPAGSSDSGLTQLQIDTLYALVHPPSSPVSGTFYPFQSGGFEQKEGWLGVTVISPSPACTQSTICVWAMNPAGAGP